MTETETSGSAYKNRIANCSRCCSRVRGSLEGNELGSIDMSIEDLLKRAYAAFNARDIEAILAVMDADVDWPNGMEGGRMIGHGQVRRYWTRQWSMIDPNVTPQRFVTEEDGRIAVDVHQVVRDLQGNVLEDVMVQHVYRVENGLIKSMEIR